MSSGPEFRNWVRDLRILTGLHEQELRASADKLPEDPWKYFLRVPGAQLVPVHALQTIRARPTGIENAAIHMARAYNGEGQKRKPISVKQNPNGTYTVLDGNSTTAIARAHGWKVLPVVVEESIDEDFKPGTVRKWKSGSMIKRTDGEWEPYEGAAKSRPATIKPSNPDKSATNVRGILAHQSSNVLSDKITPEEHIRIATEFINKHAENLPGTVERVQDVIVGDGTAVSARVKDLDSALGKLVRKPKYGTVDKLKDGTGVRVVCRSIDDVLDSVSALKKRFETSTADEEDYITKPKDGYRSYHLVIKDDDGLWKEVQVRTPNQDTWGKWAHDIYKPRTPEQTAAVSSNKDEILEYGSRMSEYYFDKDRGQEPENPPDCPSVVKATFGCLPVQDHP